ncbi:hypothetical protein Moror_15405 [Moniliophthora roreri MCA 2997]|uniref:Uncharacterized protein n=1 Tax=Moniliophthora roreri (strain MCA 2997) TaxID=1381753 RepID=V2WNZ5_MONRO|nr:hypothetical protein Moror_15405 [Moniliophthora roreri MCA 2997]
MWAPSEEHWTLTTVCWWEGWVPGKKQETLMLYLLNELHSYEEDHSNAMCPIKFKKNKSFTGEAAEHALLKVHKA